MSIVFWSIVTPLTKNLEGSFCRTCQFQRGGLPGICQFPGVTTISRSLSSINRNITVFCRLLHRTGVCSTFSRADGARRLSCDGTWHHREPAAAHAPSKLGLSSLCLQPSTSRRLFMGPSLAHGWHGPFLISGRSKLCPFSSRIAPTVARPPQVSMVGLWGAGLASFCFRLQPEFYRPPITAVNRLRIRCASFAPSSSEICLGT